MKLKLTEDKGNAVGSNYLKHNVWQIHVDLMTGTQSWLRLYVWQLPEELLKGFWFKETWDDSVLKRSHFKNVRLLVLERMNQPRCSRQLFSNSQGLQSCPEAFPIGKVWQWMEQRKFPIINIAVMSYKWKTILRYY